MVLAGALAFAGIPATNVQAAVADRCEGDFLMEDNKQDANQRNLDDGKTIVGEITLSSLDNDRDLFVDLQTDNRELDYHVFYEEVDTSCTSYPEDGHPACEGTTTDSNDPEDTGCDLIAPPDDTRTYYVNFWNNGTQSLDFKTWAAP